ncbi:cysteine-rich receptor-like protein kinase 8, partial [Tanacetum coccineum]
MVVTSTNTSTNPQNIEEDDPNLPNHPLYLHQNDHLGLVLISKKLTRSDNYRSWKRSMMIALNAKNKLKIISNSLNFLNTTASLWKELQEHYSQLDSHRIYQLTNDLVQLKQNNCAIEVFYHKLKGLWDECDALEAPYMCVCACSCENGRVNGERDQRKRLIQFLMGLDECYANVRGKILLRKNFVMQHAICVAKASRPAYHGKNRTNRNFTQGESSNRNSNQSDVTMRKSTFRKGVQNSTDATGLNTFNSA